MLSLILLLCLAFTSLLTRQTSVLAQTPFGLTANDTQGISGVGSFKLQWRQPFPFQIGVEPIGSASDDGSLWLITDPGPGRPERYVTHISQTGQISAKYDLAFPLKPSELVSYLSMSNSGTSVALLASTVSGGAKQIVESLLFLPVLRDGPGPTRRVAGRGPQFSTLNGNGKGQFISAGDEGPLTLLKLGADGSLIWRRSFSKDLVRPTVAVGATGNIFLLSQGKSYLSLQKLDETGRLLSSQQISAKQGTLIADANGGCTVLFSRGTGAKEGRVYLTSFDRTMHRSDDVETPLHAWVGQTYEVISTPQGHLAIGEGPEEGQQVAVEFNGSSKLLWQREMPRNLTSNLMSFTTGFYVVTDTNEGTETIVEKYGY
ncbi:MAG: hypothetical protein ABI824_14220 [Acidobacteriota bacterium]